MVPPNILTLILFFYMGYLLYLCHMEDNKLIAEFMEINHGDELQYDTSLKELQLVCDKIGDILFTNIKSFWYWDDCLTSKDIEIKYQGVIDFIIWYNKLLEKVKLN